MSLSSAARAGVITSWIILNLMQRTSFWVLPITVVSTAQNFRVIELWKFSFARNLCQLFGWACLLNIRCWPTRQWTFCYRLRQYSVFRTHKYEDEVQIQTCRWTWKWHACMLIQHYAKNWQSVQSEASTSITLTLFAFHSIHCNLYIIDDVGLFVKSSVLKNFSILQ